MASSFETTGGVTIMSAIYDSTAHTITFNLNGAGEGSKIKYKADSNKLTDEAENAYDAKAYTYSPGSAVWTSD